MRKLGRLSLEQGRSKGEMSPLFLSSERYPGAGGEIIEHVCGGYPQESAASMDPCDSEEGSRDSEERRRISESLPRALKLPLRVARLLKLLLRFMGSEKPSSARFLRSSSSSFFTVSDILLWAVRISKGVHTSECTKGGRVARQGAAQITGKSVTREVDSYRATDPKSILLFPTIICRERTGETVRGVCDALQTIANRVLAACGKC